jgi:hydroxyacylglutathione hydrolase
MRIVAVTETHIHADYLSGSRELAAATGATLYVSGEGGEDWQYAFEAERLRHGDAITLGNLTVEARHTPGHTPEHLSFLVTDGAFSDSPGYLLSGDFVFVGDLGRPDLLDEAAGGVDTRFAGAHQLYESLRDEFLTLPDYVQVHPAHGAGSACGRALGAIASTTVGYERENAWWAGFLRDRDEEGFVRALLDGQPDAHAYFARMKRQNKLGPIILGEMSELVDIDSETLSERLATDEVIFVDTRANADVHRGTVSRSLNVPGVEKAASYGAWVYDPEREHRPLVVLAANEAMAREFRDHVVRVGIDTVIGFTTSLAGLPQGVPAVISQDQLQTTERALLLDVRNRTEYEAGHIPGAVQLSGGRVMWRLDELPATGTIVTYCQSGVRNSVASSALRREGYDVVELDGSYAGWLDHQADKEIRVA